jgi:hypothetical protein
MSDLAIATLWMLLRACLVTGFPGGRGVPSVSQAEQIPGRTGPGKPTVPFGSRKGRDIRPFRDLSPGEFSTGRVGTVSLGLLALSRDRGGGSGDNTSASGPSPAASQPPLVTELAPPYCPRFLPSRLEAPLRYRPRFSEMYSGLELLSPPAATTVVRRPR